MPEDSHPLQAWFAEGLDEEAVWRDVAPGPALSEVVERVSTVPKPFLDPHVDLAALAGDVLPDSPDAVAWAQRVSVHGGHAERAGAALALWLFASVDLVGPLSVPLRTDHAGRALVALGLRLAPIVAPQRWLVEAERREEAARVFLLWCGQTPAGEDRDTARALLEMRDSVRREAALAQALADHAHRMRVLEQLQHQRAREAAARYTQE